MIMIKSNHFVIILQQKGGREGKSSMYGTCDTKLHICSRRGVIRWGVAELSWKSIKNYG